MSDTEPTEQTEATESSESSELRHPPVDMENAEYVGFNNRLLASTLDTLLFMLLMMPVLPVLGQITGADEAQVLMASLGPNPRSEDIALLFQAHGMWQKLAFSNTLQILILAVVVILFWRYRAATPGKMLFGMEVVDADTGLPPTRKQCIIRYIGYFVASLPLFLGFLWITFDKRKQGWHDKMANTAVVYAHGKPKFLFFK